jgi:hypothetical protein
MLRAFRSASSTAERLKGGCCWRQPEQHWFTAVLTPGLCITPGVALACMHVQASLRACVHALLAMRGSAPPRSWLLTVYVTFRVSALLGCLTCNLLLLRFVPCVSAPRVLMQLQHSVS